MGREQRSRWVEGAGGVRLHVRESGPVDAPSILFVHGWSQSHLSWRHQLDSQLADEFHLVAVDLRGHGMSEIAPRVEDYTDPAVWAADIAGVVHGLGLERPLIVGWSYGGFVTCDYVRAAGDAGLAGLSFVCWGVMMGITERELRFVGRGWHDWYEGGISDDLEARIAATRGFIRACANVPMSDEDLETVLAYNMVVTPFVRRSMTLRPPDDFTPVLERLTVPVLVTQGLADTITLRIASDHFLSVCPTARGSFYEGVGHSPFLEAPERFNRELLRFAREVHGP